MIKETCEVCGKLIEGYTDKHVSTLMEQHKIKHRNDEREQEDA